MTPEQQAVEDALRMLESDDAVSLFEWHRAGKVVAAEVRRLRAEVEALRNTNKIARDMMEDLSDAIRNGPRNRTHPVDKDLTI